MDGFIIAILILTFLALIIGISALIVASVVPGPAGTPGIRGPAGAPGSASNTGATGSVGKEGPTGPMGPKGDEGTPGSASNTGAVGPTGRGAAGQIGPTGPPGIGIQGPAGPAGGQGIQGVTGEAGQMGPAGPGSVNTNNLSTYITSAVSVPSIDTNRLPNIPTQWTNIPRPLNWYTPNTVISGTITPGYRFATAPFYSDVNVNAGTYEITYGANVQSIPGVTYFIWVANFSAAGTTGWVGTEYGANLNPIPGTVVSAIPAGTTFLSKTVVLTFPSAADLAIMVVSTSSSVAGAAGSIVPDPNAGSLIAYSSAVLSIVQLA